MTDFASLGSAAGDVLVFLGYGAPGATFTNIGGADWQINSADGLTQEVITLLGAPGVVVQDYMFI